MMRRDVIRAVGGALTAGVAGCTGYEDDDDDQQTAQQYERRCTDAGVTYMEAGTARLDEGEFYIELINYADLAGLVKVEVVFKDEDTEAVVSSSQSTVPIGGQAETSTSVYGDWPRDWPREDLDVEVNVADQDCRRVRV